MTDAPYYVGKGKGKRAYRKKRSFGNMRPNTQVIFFRTNIATSSKAKRIEDIIVRRLGRKGIDEMGILENRMLPSQEYPGESMTKEVAKKISIAKTGIKQSEEHRKNNSLGQMGKTLSEAHKNAIGKGVSKKFAEDPDARKKSGNAFRGKHRSEATKEKIKKSNKGKNKGKVPWNKGKKLGPLSAEHRAAISRGRKKTI